MKRKYIIGWLTILMVGTLLVGCGNTATGDNVSSDDTSMDENISTEDANTNDTTTNESEISGSANDTTGDTENTNDPTTEEKEVIVRTYTFPASSAATGYTVKTIEDENADWSKNETYTVLPNGNIMTFSWESPEDCGSKVYSNESTVFLKNKNEHFTLKAWTIGWTKDDYESIKSMSKEDIVAVNAVTPYVENGYYNMESTDTRLRITFAIDNPETKVKGYACFIIDDKSEIVYQFTYTESYDFYNDARAMDVVNSIEYVELPAEPNDNLILND